MQSALKNSLSKQLCLAQLSQQELSQRFSGADAEKVDAPGLAVLAEALTEIADGLLVRLEPELAESDFLHGAGLGVDQAQVAVGGWIQFLRRKNLDRVDLKAASH